ncbi:Small-conductance mechanosensitive channel [Paracoccus halophilus]|uniref:Mechanosensitive ion channel protein MscS n=1 Tax=Paracoccus halophilus TaxID=376733 RepID=A0A099F8K3_9RHOB|nr:DUF3772 domain-containing protein [Paracoccus halophilus]KGJ06543.1 mechanosensitive ion channel protein MscS [Paracoccus halophilus]SFA37791.1 Small-conductance mechanosensitive channel [Paracoccus halophilus]
MFSYRFLALILSLFLALSTATFAQTPPAPDYEAWDRLADRFEQTLASGSADSTQLDTIRTVVTEWRDRFRSQEGVNSARISTLRDQIAALGPVPGEGETEAEDVAARRQELNKQLAELQAPGLKAVEAQGRANGIIEQVDQLLRAQQADALMRKTPSPVNPARWAPAVAEAGNVAANVYDEVRTRWEANGGLTGLRDNVPFIAGFLLLALWLLTRGRRLVDTLPGVLSGRASENSRAALIFGVSLGQIAIPMIGVILAASALYATDLFASWGRPILLSVPLAALSLFGGIWLGRRMFPDAGFVGIPPLPLTEKQRGQARFRTRMLATALALHQLFTGSVLPLGGFNSGSERMAGAIPEPLSDASAGVWHFLLILLGAFYLMSLCNILRRLKRSEGQEGQETQYYRIRIMVLLAMVGRPVALLAPVAAAFGYVTAANAILWASVLTLALVGFLVILQDFIADLYMLAVRDGSARESLIPVLIGFLVILPSIPLFALIWGARLMDLSEAWIRAQEGFSFGGVRLSPMGILTFLVVFGIGYGLTHFVQGAFRSSILPKTQMDKGGQNAVVSIIGYVGIGLAAMLAINSAGIDLTSLAFVAGALSVGIGFGMQQVVSNFVSGIILLIERPVAVGDWIDVGGKQGIVKKMAVRATQIQTFDRNEIIVPNSDLITQPVTNWTRGNLTGRIIVPVGVAYGSDTRKVAKILMEIAENQPTVLINPAPFILFRGFGADSMDFEIRAMLSDINGGLGVTSEINHQIAERFAAEGIEIPFAQRDLWLRNPEALALARDAGDAAGTAGDTAAATQGDDPPPGLPRASIRNEAPEGGYRGDDEDDGDSDGDGDGDR